MIVIDSSLLDSVSEEAVKSPRKRKNYNFHESMEDSMHRMLNALEPDTYVHPHKHESPDKREVFLVLKGKAAAITFDDQGTITNSTILDPLKECFGVEIPARTWHTIVSLEPGTVIYEVKDGPYEVSSDKNFAQWAPTENDADAPAYLKTLKEQLEQLD